MKRKLKYDKTLEFACDLKKFLYKLREINNENRKEMSEKLEISLTFLNFLENGQSYFSQDYYYLIIEKYYLDKKENKDLFNEFTDIFLKYVVEYKLSKLTLIEEAAFNTYFDKLAGGEEE